MCIKENSSWLKAVKYSYVASFVRQTCSWTAGWILNFPAPSSISGTHCLRESWKNAYTEPVIAGFLNFVYKRDSLLFAWHKIKACRGLSIVGFLEHFHACTLANACVNLCVCVCVCVCVCTKSYGHRRSALGAFYFLRQGLSLNLKLINSFSKADWPIGFRVLFVSAFPH
jgi:hypothetical protein